MWGTKLTWPDLDVFFPGTLIQCMNDKGKKDRSRFGSSFKDSKKEVVRQVYLFTNHMLLTTRTSNGRLHLIKVRLQLN